MNESRLISEFMLKTGANPTDAMQCLKAWDWDLKRAITDYNDTYPFDYRTTLSESENFSRKPESSRNLIDLNNESDNNITISDNNCKQNKILSGNQSSSVAPSIIRTQQQLQNTNTEKRPVLSKADSIDVVDCRKLSRGISRATDNINLVSKARTEIAMDFRGNNSNGSNNLKKNSNFEQQITNNSLDTPDFTFILPNIFNYKEPFRLFLEKDLIECSTLQALEQSQRLNWWVDHGLCRKLWPLATTGDGNCLLHAASLGMWGFHDRKLTLRKALHTILSNGKCRDALWRRWRFQQTRLNRRAGFVYSEQEWAKEWDELVSMSSPEPRNSTNIRRRFSSSTDRHSLISAESIDDSATYESLEEIHILALAHVLRRTIIVISDTVLKDLNGEAMAPITFGGVYLPFEIDATECNRGPLLLAYDMAHFSALVPMESGSEYPPALIPLVDFENVLLPVQFCIDPGEDFNWSEYDGAEGNWALSEREQMALLKEYLDIVYATNSGTPDEEVFEDLTDDEYDKKFVESEVIIPQNYLQQQHSTNQYNLAALDEPQHGKSKAAKQLQSVAKQFGSIGKSMSKKIKKNIGSFTKIGSKNSSNKLKNTLSSGSSTQSFTCTRLLCARLRIKRHEYQEEMIRNYLECARLRYLESEKNRDKAGTVDLDRQHLEMLQLSEPDIGTVYCINGGCHNFANSDTSYLCYDCYQKQKEQESSSYLALEPRYGTGKSKFYTQADMQAHESIKNMPSAKRLSDLDHTLYLSNSTFFNDHNLLKNSGSGSNSSSNSSTSLSNSTNLTTTQPISSANNLVTQQNPTNSVSNNLVNRESYRQPYSPTVRLISEENEELSKPPTGTVSVYSPGNTISIHGNNLNGLNSNNNIINNGNAITSNFNNINNNSTSHQPVTRIIKIEMEHESTPIDKSATSSRKNSATTDLSQNNEFIETKPCKTLGCNFYGTISTNYFCSKCYQYLMTKNKNEPLIDLTSQTSTQLKQTSQQTPSTATSMIQPTNNIIKTTSPSGKPTTVYPTATATINKTGNKIMSDI